MRKKFSFNENIKGAWKYNIGEKIAEACAPMYTFLMFGNNQSMRATFCFD